MRYLACYQTMSPRGRRISMGGGDFSKARSYADTSFSRLLIVDFSQSTRFLPASSLLLTLDSRRAQIGMRMPAYQFKPRPTLSGSTVQWSANDMYFQGDSRPPWQSIKQYPPGRCVFSLAILLSGSQFKSYTSPSPNHDKGK